MLRQVQLLFAVENANNLKVLLSIWVQIICISLWAGIDNSFCPTKSALIWMNELYHLLFTQLCPNTHMHFLFSICHNIMKWKDHHMSPLMMLKLCSFLSSKQSVTRHFSHHSRGTTFILPNGCSNRGWDCTRTNYVAVVGGVESALHSAQAEELKQEHNEKKLILQ